jgi:gliding motility-associated-like protein
MVKLLLLSLLIIAVSAQNLGAQENTSYFNLRLLLVDDFIFMNNVSPEELEELTCELHLVVYNAEKVIGPQIYDDQNIKDSLETEMFHVLSHFREHGHVHHDHEYEDDLFLPSRIERPLELYGGGSSAHAPKTNTCLNADFEEGNLSGWAGGFATGGGEANINPGFQLGALNATNMNHTLMGPGAGTDGPSNNNLPRVFPGGGDYSLRIGNQQTGFQAARVSYSFVVTPATELFLYHFAVVMQDPGHSPASQPFFRINLIIDGQNIPCGEYFQAASGNAPGYLDGAGSVKYKPWETVSIALTPYIGQNATIEFTVSDCSLGGHYGYAYIDAECGIMPVLAEDTLTCAQTEITLTGPPGAAEYIWTGPGIVGPNNTQDIVVNQGGVYEVEVIPVSGPQCSYFLQTNVVDLIGNSQAAFDALPNQVCLGEEITFSDQSVLDPNAGVITDYTWDFGNGQASTDANPSHTYADPGTYEVTYAIYTSGQCTDTITDTVIVSPIPIADFSMNPVCEDTLTTFINNSSVDPIDGNIIDVYTWSFGDGNSSSLENPVHPYNEEGIYQASLVITSNNGCSDSISYPVTVWPLPEPDFTPTDVCLEFPTNFSDLTTISSANTPNNIVEWNWDFGDGGTATDQNPIYTYTSDGIFNANLTVVSNNGCTNDITNPVTVHPKPEASFTGINLEGCAPICPEVTSTSTVNNPSSIVNYKWTLSDGTVYEGPEAFMNDCFDNETSATIFYGLELEVTTEQGCVDTHNEPNYISVYHNPIADFYFLPDEPDILTSTVEFTNLSSFADIYNWNFYQMGFSNDVNPVIEYPEVPEEYNVELVVLTNEGCVDTARAVVVIKDVILFYVPNTFTPDKDDYNEVFQPVFTSGFDPNDFHLLIFNRWGEVVFESFDADRGWDGTYGAASDRIVKDGTYVWKIEFKESMSDKRHTHVGHVNVLK